MDSMYSDKGKAPIPWDPSSSSLQDDLNEEDHGLLHASRKKPQFRSSSSKILAAINIALLVMVAVEGVFLIRWRKELSNHLPKMSASGAILVSILLDSTLTVNVQMG